MCGQDRTLADERTVQLPDAFREHGMNDLSLYRFHATGSQPRLKLGSEVECCLSVRLSYHPS